LFLSTFAYKAIIVEAIAIGGDDGFELSKALCINKMPTSAKLLWNDQPWTYTLVIAKLFKWFGHNALYSRELNIALTALSVSSLLTICRAEINLFGAIVLSLVYVSFEGVISLALSTMLEPPALAIGLSALATFSFVNGRNSSRLSVGFLSGLIFAVAISMKFTVLVLALGFMVAKVSTNRTWICIVLCCSCCAGLVLIFSVFPSADAFEMLGSHWLASNALSAQDSSELTFHGYYLLANPCALLLAFSGVPCAIRALLKTRFFEEGIS